MGALRERAHYTEGAVLRQARRGACFSDGLRHGLPCGGNAGYKQLSGLLYNAAV